MVTQVPAQAWPSGDSWPVAALDATAAELTQRFGLHFESDVDGLGVYQLAALEDRRVGQILLTWRDHPADRATVVEVDTAARRDDVLNALWRQLQLDIRALEWVTPFMKFPGYTPNTDEPTAVAPISRIERGLQILTARETEVLQLIEAGRDPSQVAAELRITPGTVGAHLRSIAHKLGIRSGADLRLVVQTTPLLRSA